MNLTQQTYDKIAEDWHKNHRADDWWVEGTDKFVSLLSPGAEVLDVGCGGGTKSKYLLAKGLSVTGIDFSKGQIAICQREVPDAEFFVMPMQEVAELGKEFDAVFAQASLLHIPKAEVQEVIEKLVAVIKKSGFLYVAVKKIRPGQPDEDVLVQDDWGYEYKRFFSYYDLAELRRYFEKAELEVVWDHEADSSRPGGTVWLQIIGKKV